MGLHSGLEELLAQGLALVQYSKAFIAEDMEDVLSLKIPGSHSVCVHSTPVTYALWKRSYVGIYDACVFTESSQLVLGVCDSLSNSLESMQTTKTVIL